MKKVIPNSLLLSCSALRCSAGGSISAWAGSGKEGAVCNVWGNTILFKEIEI